MNPADGNNGHHRYQRYHHHAWAGTVILSVLLALRIFLEMAEAVIDDRVFLTVGLVLIAYILVALFFTYRYRFGLGDREATDRPPPIAERTRPDAAVDLEHSKAAESIAKTEAKAQKKATKAAIKVEKKALKQQNKQEKD